MVNIKQYEKEYLMEFTKRFRNAKGIMDTQHGKLILSKYIQTLTEYDESKPEKVKLDSEEAHEKFISYTFIQGTYKSIIVKHEEYLANKFALGINSYQCVLENVKNIIINDKKYFNNTNHHGKKN